MADFCTASEVRAYINPAHTDPGAGADDASIAFAIPAATSAIVRACNRTFEVQGSAADRLFTARYPYSTQLGAQAYWYPWPAAYPFTGVSSTLPAPILYTDDFFLTNQTIGQITVTDRTTGTTYTPKYSYPYNADSKGLPFYGLVFDPGTSLSTAEGQIKVNAKWGFITVPITIKQAALIQVSRYLKRRDSPFGVAGDSAISGGVVTLRAALDPDVQMMLADYRKWWSAV